MRSVVVVRKDTGEFRLLRYEERIRRTKFRWMPFGGVYDPVEAALERGEPARPSRTRNARVRGCWWREVLQQEEFVKLGPNRGPERRWCDRARNEHNANV